MRISVLALLAVSCQLHDGWLDPKPPARDVPFDAAVPLRDAEPPLDASIDASHCAVDADHDGSCAGDDCDDLNPRRSPERDEYCPDRIDNDCDGLVDYDDECDALNDDCEGPVTVLAQDADIDPSTWAFNLPLGARYQDDTVAGLSAGNGDCTGDSGQGGSDAVFQLTAATDATVEVTARGLAGAVPVVIVRTDCARGQEADLCDVADEAPASVSGLLDAGQDAWLIVDDEGLAPDGVVHVEIQIAKQNGG